MHFFQTLAPLLEGQDLTITLRGGMAQMTVSVLPKNTGNAHEMKLSPIIISGSAEELDGAFLETVSKPIEQARGIISSTAAFHESVKAEEEAAKKKKKEPEAKKTAKKPQPKPAPKAVPSKTTAKKPEEKPSAAQADLFKEEDKTTGNGDVVAPGTPEAAPTGSAQANEQVNQTK